MAYVFDVLTGNVFIIALCLAVDLLVAPPATNNPASPKPQQSRLLLLIDENMLRFGNTILGSVSGRRNSQLVVFLVANIMTGIINLTMRTLFASELVSMLVINTYMLAVSVVGIMAPRVLQLVGRIISKLTNSKTATPVTSKI
jgi:phosphatidylinositol glycan class W